MKKQTQKEKEDGVYRLDEYDEKIIRVLTENARIPAKDLAIKTGLSRQTSDYRLDRLICTGIIRGFCVDIDWSKVADE